MSRSQLAPYIPELDGLRGIAILLVIIHHFWPRAGFWARYEKLPHLGWIGVDLFFVISGFLIGGILLDSAGEPNYYHNFYIRRSLRIFPLYYLFLVAMFTTFPIYEHGQYMQTKFILESGNPAWYFCYLGNVREAIIGHEPAYCLAPLWSLSIEEQFYLVFPFLISTLSRNTLKRLMLILIFAAPLFRTIMLFVAPFNERIQYLATFSRIDVLSMGVLLALMLRMPGPVMSHQRVGWFAVGGLSTMTMAFYLNGLDRMRPFCRTVGYSLVGGTFALCVLWAVLKRPAFLRVLVLRRVGNLCYGIYLLQRPTEVVVVKCLPYLHIHLSENGLPLMGLKMIATFGVAWCSWNLFEKRILKLKDRFTSKPPRQVLTAQ